jgi:hypothetical protein
VGKACHRLHSSTKRNGGTAFLLPPKLHRVAEEYLPGSADYWPTFPLAPALGSIHFSPDHAASFVDFTATTAESDFSRSFII